MSFCVLDSESVTYRVLFCILIGCYIRDDSCKMCYLWSVILMGIVIYGAQFMGNINYMEHFRYCTAAFKQSLSLCAIS